ncbi:MAG: RelA/SpoT family protein [Candidatus Woesearchaeota archaeon]
MNEKLLELIKEKNPYANIPKIQKAYEFAKKAHEGQKRKTGEDFITHPLEVVSVLVKHNYTNTSTICAALLHDTIEDTTSTIEQIEQEFSSKVSNIVDGLTKIDKTQISFEKYKAENLRKIILASAKDIRVIIVKFADRIANLQTLSTFRIEKQKRIAQDTLTVYSPIAEKMGMYHMKAELEDAAFLYLHPKFYNYIKENIVHTHEQRELKTNELITILKEFLQKKNIPAQIQGRAKHYYSIYKKMIEENKPFSAIYDLYGIRIIVEHESECYQVHECLLDLWTPVEHRFKDYIKKPKPNGYQSLHENFLFEDRMIEVQIRTREMDYLAENGPATHWRYKGINRDKQFERKLSWLRQILDWKRQNAPLKPELQNIDVDIFKNEVIVITPKGDPILLKEKSTPIDFAYAIHSKIGDHLKSAYVNDSIVSLSHELKSGDIVRIETTNKATVNSSWLSIVKTNQAVYKIRRALSIDADKTKKKSAPDISNVYNTLQTFRKLIKSKNIKLSKCCNPKEMDAIVAFYTKDKKSITVHKLNCPHQYSLNPKNKVILQKTVHKKKSQYYLDILIEERPGLLVDVLKNVLEHKIHIHSITSKDANQSILVSLTISKTSKELIERAAKELRKMEGIADIKISDKE